MELDFAGKTLCIRDRKNPSITTKVTIFAALSLATIFIVKARSIVFITGSRQQQRSGYFGGYAVITNDLKVAVIRNKDWIDPVLNKDFKLGQNTIKPFCSRSLIASL